LKLNSASLPRIKISRSGNKFSLACVTNPQKILQASFGTPTAPSKAELVDAKTVLADLLKRGFEEAKDAVEEAVDID
jgi:hypothetical protein